MVHRGWWWTVQMTVSGVQIYTNHQVLNWTVPNWTVQALYGVWNINLAGDFNVRPHASTWTVNVEIESGKRVCDLPFAISTHQPSTAICHLFRCLVQKFSLVHLEYLVPFSFTLKLFLFFGSRKNSLSTKGTNGCHLIAFEREGYRRTNGFSEFMIRNLWSSFMADIFSSDFQRYPQDNNN